jgi:hypothetical protein
LPAHLNNPICTGAHLRATSAHNPGKCRARPVGCRPKVGQVNHKTRASRGFFFVACTGSTCLCSNMRPVTWLTWPSNEKAAILTPLLPSPISILYFEGTDRHVALSVSRSLKRRSVLLPFLVLNAKVLEDERRRARSESPQHQALDSPALERAQRSEASAG